MASPRLTNVLVSFLALVSMASCELFTGPDAGFQGRLDDQLLGTQGRPFGFGIASNGKGLALQLDRVTAARFNIQANRIQDFVPLAWNPIDVAFTRSGAFAYVTILDGSRVYKVNMSNGAVVDSVTFGQNHHRILMHPDDSQYWVFSLAGKVWTVNRASGARTDSATFGGQVIRGVARHASDGTLAISAGSSLILLNGATLDVITSRDLGGLPQEVVYSKDGASIFVALEDSECLLVLDATTLAPTDTVLFNGALFFPFGMRLSPDGGTLLVSSPATGLVAVVDASSHQLRRTLNTGGTPRRIAFTPTGGMAFVTNEGGWIDVIH